MDAVSAASSDENDLLTVAVAPGDGLGVTLERIEEEAAEAEYLDGGASEPLREALDRARRLLHDYDEFPENGLVLYVGVVDGDLVEHVFDDLPGPVDESVYRRSNEFDVEPLESAMRAEDAYGLVVVERGGAALGRLEGDEVVPIETIESDVAGKTRAGGQSADRFERRREEQKAEFFGTVADAAERAFLDPAADAGNDGNGGTEAGGGDGGGGGPDAGDAATDEAGGDAVPAATVDGLLLGGTTVTADEFRNAGVLDRRLDDLLLGDAVAVEYASEQGLRQLAETAADRLPDGDRAMRDAVDRFFAALADEDEAAVYGRDETDDALEYGAVGTLLVSTDLDGEVIHELGDRATEKGGETFVVPTDFERGERFAEAFRVGALLRYPIE